MKPTGESEQEFAKAFMTFVYERIKHGDEQHKQWLKEECEKLEKDLADRVTIFTTYQRK